MRKRAGIGRAEAEHIGLQALLFMTSDPGRLERFMSLTGLGPAELKASAGNIELHVAMLDHLAEDESQLLVFAASIGLDPQAIATARAVLAGTGEVA